MIDKVKISKIVKLDTNKFNKKMKLHKVNDAVNYETGELYNIDCYKCKLYNNISIIYSNITNKLTIQGRLINIHYLKNKVYNYDDYLRPRLKENIESETIIHDNDYLMEHSYYDADDKLCFPNPEETTEHIEIIESHFDDMIYSLNYEINKLLGTSIIVEEKAPYIPFLNERYDKMRTYKKDILDVRTFKIVNIEICFNIWLKKNYVKEYIELFNLIFKARDDKRYKNHVLEQGLETHTSFYVKTASQYRDNLKTNYVVNFYNKHNQLKSLEEDYNVTKNELEIAQGLLRMEVQLYYTEIKKVCNKYNIKNTFDDFLNLELCLDILKDKYNYFIGDSRLDFYSYKKAKEKIKNSMMLSKLNKFNLLNYLREKYQSNKKHSYATRLKYNKMLHMLRIHEHFIPTVFDIEYMKSPIRLLNQKINRYRKENKSYIKDTLKTIQIEEFKSI